MKRELTHRFETFEKCSILFKVKPLARRAYAPEGKANILTAGIQSQVFRGLKSESDAACLLARAAQARRAGD
jgi:hypothetical protein